MRCSDAALLQAVEWMVSLRSGPAGPSRQALFEAWRAAHPDHEAACEHVTRSLEAVETLRAGHVSAALAHHSLQESARRSSRRAMLSLAGLGACVGAGWLGWQVTDQQGFLADQHTGLARRQQESLPDGSTLWLDARTAVDMGAGGSRQALTLRHGRMLVEAVVADRPLEVRAGLARMSASGARFIVQARDADQLEVTALSGRVAMQLPAGQRLELPAGRRAALTADAAPILTAARGTEDLWTRGLIAMDNEPLQTLVNALQDYRPGMLRATPEAAELRVSGLFSLDDPERTLLALAETRPVRIRSWTRYWVVIEATA